MKKFVHIPTGKVITIGGHGTSMQALVTNTESTLILGDLLKGNDWKEVKEDPYKILSFINPNGNRVYEKLAHNEKFICFPYDSIGARTYEFCLAHYSINSILRVSDGKIFTIGDKVRLTIHPNREARITRFFLDNGVLWTTIGNYGYNKLESFDHVPVKEREWRITSFRCIKSPNVSYSSSSIEEEEHYLKDSSKEIETVIRLKDKAEFVVGGFAKTSVFAKVQKIKSFFIWGETLQVALTICNYNITSSNLNPIKMLFTTEDGVNVFAGDKGPLEYGFYPCINLEDWFIDTCDANSCYATNPRYKDVIKIFSTVDAAKEYLVMNKPVLSIKQVYALIDKSQLNLTNLKALVNKSQR